MKIDLEKNEIMLLKHLVKKENKEFEENHEDIELGAPHIVELALEEKYEVFLDKLLKKLE